MNEYSFEQANAFARAALDEMDRHRIPADPVNFRVWFAYIAGEDPGLNRAIDVLISNGQPFTAERNAEIAEQFFGFEANAELVTEAGKRLEALAGQIMEQIGAEKGETAADRDRFDSLASDVDDAATGVELADVARNLVKTTQAILSRQARLEKELGEARNEASGLHNSLVEFQEKANTDALTGLGNRRKFEAILREEAIHSGETGDALSLIMLDVDHFKKFNDQFGHQIGDETLKIVANRLRQSLPDGGSPARYGGEEFIALLPGTGIENAAEIAECIRVDLASNTLKNRRTGEQYGKITASFGVAGYHIGENLQAFVRRADEALYRAKRDGRNQVAVAEADDLLQLD